MSAPAFFKYESGKYIFKKWQIAKDNYRIPVKCKKSSNPDLQSTYFTNTDGNEVLRYIRLDVDFEKSNDEFKKDNKLCWELIQNSLGQYSKILEGIEYVTRSTSGRGLHILFGVSPLPLYERTQGAQISARQLQYQLIQIFNELGIGADPSGLGLKQDFCTYNKRSNLVYHNELLTKRIEREAKKSRVRVTNEQEVILKQEPFITNLLKYVEYLVKELEINYRFYPDIRVEKSYSKLFLYLMGLYTPKQIDAKSFLNGEKKLIDLEVPYVSAYKMVELSKFELANIMQVNLRTANMYIRSDRFQEIFFIKETIEGAIKLGCKPSKKVLKQIDRAQKVMASNISQTSVKLKIIEPFRIVDGERNYAIVNWIIAYKWNGYSEQETFEKIKMRTKFIMGNETSRTCKENQIKSTVHSIYQNRKELFGIGKLHLPNWMEDDKYFLKGVFKSSPEKLKSKHESNFNVTPFCSFLGPFISSRSIAPFAIAAESERGSFSPIENEQKAYLISGLENLKCYLFQGLLKNLLSFPVQSKDTKLRIDAVSFHHRVGFFYQNKLILCVVKNQHYKLTLLLPKLRQILGKEISASSIIHIRKNTKSYSSLAGQLYDENVFALNAQHICGKKFTRSENMHAYFVKRAKILGVSLQEYLNRTQVSNFYKSNVNNDRDIPF
nr:hypothetical protein GTC16762_31380 [Pigmentibacter ruber]